MTLAALWHCNFLCNKKASKHRDLIRFKMFDVFLGDFKNFLGQFLMAKSTKFNIFEIAS